MPILCLADGFCKNNGRGALNEQTGYSFAVYRVTTHEVPVEVLPEVLRDSELLEHTPRAELLPGVLKPTNNVAEVTALHQVVAYLTHSDIAIVEFPAVVLMDSELVVNQFNGLYKVRDTQLKNLYHSVYDMLKEYKNKHSLGCVSDIVQVRWVPGTVMKKTVIGH